MRTDGAVAAGAAGLVLAHVLPGATWLPPVRALFPRLAGRGARDHVALTFDDGPDPESTPLFLDALAAADVRATFFVLAALLRRCPDLGRRLVDEGHEVAVHGWTHTSPLLTPPGSLSGELRRAAGLVYDVTGQAPRWYRPAYGALSAEALRASRRLGLRPVLWTAWGKDWTADARAETVLARLEPGIEGGATLLLHDCDRTCAPGAWRSALGALPGVIARCRALGLGIGPLRDHGLALR